MRPRMKLAQAALVAFAALSMGVSGAHAADREVTIDGGKAALHGTLTTPDAPRPGPAVLLIAGSGPTDRDGNQASGRMTPATLKLLAQALSDAGYASLRFDKRGIGASAAAAPPEADLRFGTYVDDAVAWTKRLAAEPNVRGVVILGHSEGALIGALAAAKTPVCGLISVSGAGRRASELIAEQLGRGLPPRALPAVVATLAKLDAGETVADPPPGLSGLFRPSVQPYLISWFKADPAKALAAVTVPVLILQGDTDIQVPVGDARTLAAAAPRAKLVVLPGVNHVLKAAPATRAANLATYADPSLPLGPGVKEAVVGFVSSLDRAPPARKR